MTFKSFLSEILKGLVIAITIFAIAMVFSFLMKLIIVDPRIDNDLKDYRPAPTSVVGASLFL